MTVQNPEIYKKAVRKVTQSYGKRTSAYRSMAIVKAYKELGGKYASQKTPTGTTRWLKEKWIQVIPYLLRGETKACGDSTKRHACRPLKRISAKTPLTIKELIKLHGENGVRKLAVKKRKGAKRVNWTLSQQGSNLRPHG